MWSPEEFEAQLRLVGEERYHHKHPFNLRMHEGTLRQDEIRRSAKPGELDVVKHY